MKSINNHPDTQAIGFTLKAQEFTPFGEDAGTRYANLAYQCDLGFGNRITKSTRERMTRNASDYGVNDKYMNAIAL